ncbi:MAG: nickel-dependent lactate racemase [Chloroflexi bacterium]|nr:nickel-dependent lactate racemase [Chloroflexota bacterium]
MLIELAYGRDGLTVDLPDDVDILRPAFVPGVGNEAQALRDALHHPINSPPLRELVTSDDRVVIVHTDITRPTPNDRIMPVLTAELEQAGVRPENITLLNGLGTHRFQTDAELRQMLGNAIVDRYRCLQHDCTDDASLVSLGQTSKGHPVRINRHYMESSFKILTGFIEPHFFAGFSGGPKAVLPALAGTESVYTNHGYGMISHTHAAWGITEGNPIWEEMCEMALRTEPHFLLNVTLNNKREITGIFAGDLLTAHKQGTAFVKEHAMVAVDAPYDVVVTTNSGYPLDQNLYQAVKGMSAAVQILRKGGAILIAAACEDGLPHHGLYAELLQQAGSPQRALEMIAEPGFEAQDQWQVQIQAQIQLKADVYVYADGLTDSQIEQALCTPSRNIESTLADLKERYGSRIAVVPEGPQTIPYLAHQREHAS